MSARLQPVLGQRVVLREYGETPEDALARCVTIEPMTSPATAGLRPGDVVVEVKSAAVALIDAMMLSGQYHHKPALAFTPGMEYAGVVRWVGSQVDPAHLSVGDLVLNDFMLTGPRSAGTHQAQGGWASYAVAPQESLHRVPPGMSLDQACNFLLNYETAYFALVTRGGLRAGEVVLVNGASGAAGLAAVQMAKLLGATVIAAGRSDQKLVQVRAAGADHVLNVTTADSPKATRRFRDEVKALTAGRGADLVYDTVGGEVSRECLRSLAFGGRQVIVGWASNKAVAQGGGRGGSVQPDVLPTNIIQLKGLAVMGSPMVITGMREPAARRERLQTIFSWAEAGRIQPVVSRAFPLALFREAVAARLDAGVVGGCVLHPWAGKQAPA